MRQPSIKQLIGLMRKTEVPNGPGGAGFGLVDVPALAVSSVPQVRAIAKPPHATRLVEIEKN